MCPLGLAIILRPYKKLMNARCIYCLQQLDIEVTASDEHVLQAWPPEKLHPTRRKGIRKLGWLDGMVEGLPGRQLALPHSAESVLPFSSHFDW